MSIFSNFLRLFKYEPTTDAQNTFNIQAALNDNWDKVDNFAVNVSQQMEQKADKTDNRLNTTNKDLALAINETFQYANNGKTALRTALSNKGVTVSLEDTFTLLASKITAQMCKFGGTTVVTDVLSGKTFINNSGEILTGTMANQGAVSQALTTQGGQYTIQEGYHNGSGKITANISNLVAGNIKKGVNAGGVIGTMEEGGLVYEQTITLTNSQFRALPLTKNGIVSNNNNYRIVDIGNLPFTPKIVEFYTHNEDATRYYQFVSKYPDDSNLPGTYALSSFGEQSLFYVFVNGKFDFSSRNNIRISNNAISIDVYNGLVQSIVIKIRVTN